MAISSIVTLIALYWY